MKTSELYTKYNTTVKAAVRRIVKSDEWEDVASDAWVSILENVDRFNGGSDIKTWIYAIASNKAKAFVKSKKLVQLDDSYEVADSSGNPRDIAQANEVLAKIDKAFNLMSDKTANVVFDCEVYGDSLLEAAAKYGIPHGTVKSTLSRGREIIKRHTETVSDFY